MPKSPRNPRYKQNKQVNPIYKDWDKAVYMGNTYNFKVPKTEVKIPFDIRQLTPIPNAGSYGYDNYDLGANRAIQYMKDFPDASPWEAIGIAASEMKESGTNPTAMQGVLNPQIINKPTKKDLASPLGIGRIQISNARKKDFVDFVGKDPKKAVDPYYQTEFIRAERAGKIGTEKNKYAMLKDAKNAADAGWLAAKHVIRPNQDPQHFIDRMENADSILSRLTLRNAQIEREKQLQAALQQPSMWQKFLNYIIE
jgi:hypothetical protein